MAPPLLPLPFSLIFKTLLFLSIFFPTYCASDVEGYTACVPFSCGNFSDISYPFWGNNRPDYCGHPKFKLGCQQDQVTIDILSQKFLVVDITQHTQNLKIARLDLWSGPCSNDYTNVGLDFDFFSYTLNDDNITLLYDCSIPYAPPESFSSSLTFSCIINGASAACLVVSTNVFVDVGCKFSIMVPVLIEALQSSIKGDLGVGYVLDKGFEVVWSGVNGDQCGICVQSGGRCGHNATTNEFICFCHNQQPYGGICDNTPAWSPLRALTPSPTPSQALSSTNLPKYQVKYHGATSMYSSFF